jgi:hypothetical protein
MPLGYPETMPPEHDDKMRKQIEDFTYYEMYGKKVSK